MKKKIYLCLAHMSENGIEQKYIQEAFNTNWVVPLGPNVDGFEKDLEKFVGDNKKVVALSSGTAAVHLSLVDLGVKEGDEVICQSFTFCASCHPALYLGATPILIDSEKDSWNMDPELLEYAILDRINKTGKAPKAIVVVYLYGMPAKINEIVSIANKYNIPLVEDAAEAFGSSYKGHLCGTFGKYGVLSFNGNKMITTSGGGALICNDENVKHRIMFYSTQARESYPYYQHEHLGYNYRMSNICAGIGRGQMTIADKHISHHRHVAALYKEKFKNVDGITFHENPSSDYNSNYWLNTILIDKDIHVDGEENAYNRSSISHTDCEPNANVEALRAFLDSSGIETRPLWKPMHKQPVYKGAPYYENGNSVNLFKQGLCLPSGPTVTDDDIDYIVDSIVNYCNS